VAESLVAESPSISSPTVNRTVPRVWRPAFVERNKLIAPYSGNAGHKADASMCAAVSTSFRNLVSALAYD
jgi:hypothetical protein